MTKTKTITLSFTVTDEINEESLHKAIYELSQGVEEPDEQIACLEVLTCIIAVNRTDEVH